MSVSLSRLRGLADFVALERIDLPLPRDYFPKYCEAEFDPNIFPALGENFDATFDEETIDNNLDSLPHFPNDLANLDT